MYWIKDLQNAIYFIEDRLLENLSVEEIAKRANSYSANFQKIFTIVTGMTVVDYIPAASGTPNLPPAIPNQERRR